MELMALHAHQRQKRPAPPAPPEQRHVLQVGINVFVDRVDFRRRAAQPIRRHAPHVRHRAVGHESPAKPLHIAVRRVLAGFEDHNSERISHGCNSHSPLIKFRILERSRRAYATHNAPQMDTRCRLFVWVSSALADVSAAVTPGSALDRHAAVNTTSIYTPPPLRSAAMLTSCQTGALEPRPVSAKTNNPSTTSPDPTPARGAAARTHSLAGCACGVFLVSSKRGRSAYFVLNPLADVVHKILICRPDSVRLRRSHCRARLG